MWFPSSTFSHFLSFHRSSSSDRCDTNWFLYFAFVLSTISSSSVFTPTLLLFQPFLRLWAHFVPSSFLSVSLPAVVFSVMDVTAIDFFFLSFTYFSLSLSLSIPYSLLSLSFLPPTCSSFLPVANVMISSSGGGREECRLNCRMANNCTTLIAILHSVFRNNQITLCACVCVYACGRMCVHQPEIVQMSAENCRSAAAISSLLSV